MGLIGEFISEYGTAILYTAVTAIAGYLGIVIKRLCERYINDKTKQTVARTVVRAVEQLYKELDGEEKLGKAIESISQILSEKGINITELELRMLIESAVEEFNESFGNSKETALP